MIINLEKPPHFLTFDPKTREFSEGVAVTPEVRRHTCIYPDQPLPQEMDRLTVGRVIGYSSNQIRLNISPPEKPYDDVLVWVLADHLGDCPWTVHVSFYPTTADELAKLYGPRPDDWVAGRSDGVPKPITKKLCLIKRVEKPGFIRIQAVETKLVRDVFCASALGTAEKFLAEQFSAS